MPNNHSRGPAVICLMGPTACGKTRLAVELVQQRPVEIISVDSAQVYRDMNIGSGKPDSATLKLAPHRLIDIRDPAEPYSAADFRQDALQQIREVISKGRTPLLVGGTMLYFKVLRDGLADLPVADPDIRRQIDRLAELQGWQAVHDRLAEVDPASAQRIHPNDPQRLQRALEVYMVTGRSMTQIHKTGRIEAAAGTGFPFSLYFLAIQPEDRSVLHSVIDKRFREMLFDGLVEEVETLFRREDLNPDLPSIRSVGYRQVWQYLAGDLSYDGMVEKGIIATRQLAKRQMTWLRSWSDLHVLTTELTGQKKSLDNALKFVDSVSI
ncbi:MAG: tRNA (adenosine(37)-N6)-dimethylallyltransferase MiaA [Pseudohongiellaceae bacterium]